MLKPFNIYNFFLNTKDFSLVWSYAAKQCYWSDENKWKSEAVLHNYVVEAKLVPVWLNREVII